MKRIILLAVLLTAIVWSYSQTDSVFYYYHGEHETFISTTTLSAFFSPQKICVLSSSYRG